MRGQRTGIVVPSRVVVTDVLVVGGGIIGVSVAAQCARRGMGVVLCERHGLATAASGRNSGIVVGPHPEAMRPIAAASIREYEQLSNQTGGAFAYDRLSVGSLRIGDDAEEPGEELDEPALRAVEPLLADSIRRAVLVECRRIDPRGAVAAFAQEARDHRASILVGCDVKSLRVSGSRITGAYADHDEILAGTVVLAAGHWSRSLLHAVGRDLPVRPVRGWTIVTEPAPFTLAHVIEAGWDAAATARLVDGVTLGELAQDGAPPVATMPGIVQDHAGRIVVAANGIASLGDRDEDAETRAELARRAVTIVPSLAGLRILETRSCVRPMTPDGLPYHGPVPGADGLIACVGHNAQGVTWGPGSGLEIAEGLEYGRWNPDLAPERAA